MGIPINPIHLLILHSLLGGGRQQPNHFGWGPANGMGMGRPGMGGMGQQPNHFGWGPQGGDLLSQIMQMGQGGARATGDPMGFGGQPLGGLTGNTNPWNSNIVDTGGAGTMSTGRGQIGDSLKGLMGGDYLKGMVGFSVPPKSSGSGLSSGSIPPYMLNTSGQFQPGLPNNASSGGASNHLQGLLDMLNR